MSDKPALAAFFPEPMTRGADRGAHRTTTAAGWARCWRSTTWSSAWSRRCGSAGVYGDTDIIYTSDNGWILGEHRLRDPITEDGRAVGREVRPVRGLEPRAADGRRPGLPEGEDGARPGRERRPAPTILDIADARPKLAQDGVSLVRAARTPSLLDGRGVLLETFENPRGVSPYTAIRTERYRYEVADGRLHAGSTT